MASGFSFCFSFKSPSIFSFKAPAPGSIKTRGWQHPRNQCDIGDIGAHLSTRSVTRATSYFVPRCKISWATLKSQQKSFSAAVSAMKTTGKNTRPLQRVAKHVRDPDTDIGTEIWQKHNPSAWATTKSWCAMANGSRSVHQTAFHIYESLWISMNHAYPIFDAKRSCRMTWNSESRVTTSWTLCLGSLLWRVVFHIFWGQGVVSFCSLTLKFSKLSTWKRSRPFANRNRFTSYFLSSLTIFLCIFFSLFKFITYLVFSVLNR